MPFERKHWAGILLPYSLRMRLSFRDASPARLESSNADRGDGPARKNVGDAVDTSLRMLTVLRELVDIVDLVSKRPSRPKARCVPRTASRAAPLAPTERPAATP